MRTTVILHIKWVHLSAASPYDAEPNFKFSGNIYNLLTRASGQTVSTSESSIILMITYGKRFFYKLQNINALFSFTPLSWHLDGD